MAKKQKTVKSKQGNVFSRALIKFGGLNKYAQVLVFALLFGVIGGGGFAVYSTFAATGITTKPPAAPTIYISPTTQNLGLGETFTISLKENSGTTKINAVQAKFTYPTSLVEFVPTTGGTNGVDYTGSAFGTRPSTIVDTKTGTIDITLGTTTPLTGDKLMAKLKFKTKTTGGEIKFTFNTTSSMLLSSSTNKNILPGASSLGNAKYISNPSSSQCELLGRVWENNACAPKCKTGAGTYTSSTPWSYCSNAIDKKITQSTCASLNRKWLNNGCARFWDRTTDATYNAKQCTFATNVYDVHTTNNNDTCYKLDDTNNDGKVNIVDLSFALVKGTIPSTFNTQ